MSVLLSASRLFTGGRRRGANWQLRIGLAIVGTVALSAFVLAVLLDDRVYAQDVGALLQTPSIEHLFGTDNLGRDQLARIAAGTRSTLLVSFGAVAIGALIGVPLGITSAYARGRLEFVAGVAMDLILAMPALVLALTLAATLGRGPGNVTIAIGVIFVPQFFRISRSQALIVCRQPYVASAITAGASASYIVLVYVLRNALAPIVAYVFLSLSVAVMAEAALSYLGVGAAPPAASLGYMIRAGTQYLQLAPWQVIVPGAVILLMALGLNLIGDGLERHVAVEAD